MLAVSVCVLSRMSNAVSDELRSCAAFELFLHHKQNRDRLQCAGEFPSGREFATLGKRHYFSLLKIRGMFRNRATRRGANLVFWQIDIVRGLFSD